MFPATMRVDSAEPGSPTWITVQPVAGRKPKPSTSVRALLVGVSQEATPKPRAVATSSAAAPPAAQRTRSGRQGRRGRGRALLRASSFGRREARRLAQLGLRGVARLVGETGEQLTDDVLLVLAGCASSQLLQQGAPRPRAPRLDRADADAERRRSFLLAQPEQVAEQQHLAVLRRAARRAPPSSRAAGRCHASRRRSPRRLFESGGGGRRQPCWTRCRRATARSGRRGGAMGAHARRPSGLPGTRHARRSRAAARLSGSGAAAARAARPAPRRPPRSPAAPAARARRPRPRSLARHVVRTRVAGCAITT